MVSCSTRFSILNFKDAFLNEISNLLRLRVAIGFLGEKSQFNWWQSDFFGATSPSFLDPVFPRSRLLAQVDGATAAACRLHDDRIGTGRVFHLFRLPEDFEQAFHQQLQDTAAVAELAPIIESKEAAVEYLKNNFGKSKGTHVGPILVGSIADVTTDAIAKSIAQAYMACFESKLPAFPFLKDEQ